MNGLTSGGGRALWRHLWLLPPLALALWVFFPSVAFEVGGDGWRYMARAIGLVEGRGYVDIDWSPLTYRGPLYPLWLAAFFAPFGYDVAVASFATRTFSILGVVVIYLLGARWFSPPAGALAGLLVLTSASLAAWSDRVHLDYPLAVMMMLSVLALTWALEEGGWCRHALAGLALGAAYLCKQTAILLVPLPFLAVAACPAYRTRSHARGLASWVAGFLALVGPWWIYVWRVSNEFSLVGGGSAAVTSSWFLEAAGDGRLNLLASLRSYYRGFLASEFGLAPLLVVAWVATLVIAVRGREWARVACLGALCLAPLLVLQGSIGYRPQQSMAFYMLSFLALVGSGWSLWRAAAARLGGRRAPALVALGAAAGLIAAQIASERGAWLRYLRSHDPVAHFQKDRDELEPVRDRHRRMAKWLLANVPAATPLLGTRSPVGAVIYYSGARYPVYPPPKGIRFTVRLGGSEGASEPVECTDAGSLQPMDKVLFLWVEGGQREERNRVHVRALTEDRVLSSFGSTGARYLVLTGDNEFTAPYYIASRSFRPVRRASRPKLRLIEVRRLRRSPFELRVDERLPRLMARLRDTKPAELERLTDCFLARRLGLRREKIRAIIDGRVPTFSYDHKLWALPRNLRGSARKESSR